MKKAIISGGGTGGHIFPAIAIADALKAKYPDIDILFVGAKDRMEMEKVPAAGYKIEGLWISGLQRRLTAKNLSFPFKVISSLWNARKLVKKHKPEVAIGVGGYASGPLLRMAASAGVPCLVQEQNSFPGITNRLLGSKVQRVCTAYDNMERWFPKEKIVKTGNPVRKAVTEIGGKKERALTHFQLEAGKTTLLAVGGSLGARSINQGIAALLPYFAEKDIQVIWQTGKGYTEQASSDLSQGQFPVKAHTFIKEMDLAYAAADIVISRAGAMSISELCLVGKPCILVPSPYVSEDHQTKNANALVENGAALLVKDAETKTALQPAIEQLLQDTSLQEKMHKALKAMAIADATERILSEVEKIISDR